MEGAVNPRQKEILRQASVALHGRVVTLWEVSPASRAVSVATSLSDPPHHGVPLDLDRTLLRWGIPISEGSRWVGCRLDDNGTWCVAPVRRQPPAPPPGGVERRSGERMTLELAGLCLGLVEDAPAPTLQAPPSPTRLSLHDAQLELLRKPSAIAAAVANPLTTALMSLELSLERVNGADQLEPGFRAGLLEDLASVAEGMEQATAYLRALQDRVRGMPARNERFDAAAVVRSCVVLERPLARRQGVTLQSAIGTGGIFLRGDPNVLYQVLTQLIRNAVGASRQHKLPVVVGLGQVDDTLRLTVQDRGIVIAPERIEATLASVRQLTEEMFDGRIVVESAPAGATTFAVVLPLPPQRERR